jgi:hypothetical protein
MTTPPDNTSNRTSTTPVFDDAARRAYAGTTYHLLLGVRVLVALCYDGDYTVVAGPVRLFFAEEGLHAQFPDPDSDTTVTLTMIGENTFGNIVTLVEALLYHPGINR